MKKKLVVLSGAGMSQESGLKTFRDMGGLWENYDVNDVASIDGWYRNPELVMNFYNQRRKHLYEVEPNAAHYALVELEKKFNVQIITQNVDDLHERAGSKNVMHLHGELKKVRSTVDDNLIYELKSWELKKGDLCEKGSQLRPHIVWFGEAVPQIVPASRLAEKADIFMVIGTSMNVYPAAGLLSHAPSSSIKYLIDPNAKDNYYVRNLNIIREKAGIGVPLLVEELLK